MVNLTEHEDGKGPDKDLSLAEALSGQVAAIPCVGRFLEFRVVPRPARSRTRARCPPTLIPNPDLSAIPVARHAHGSSSEGAPTRRDHDPVTSFVGPWGIETDDGDRLAPTSAAISAAPKFGTREIWTLKNGGGGWDHPIHIHFEEGQILARNGSASNVPAWERGRKDVYRLRPGGSRHDHACSSATGAACSWSTATTPCTRTTPCCCAGRSTTAGAPFLRPLPTPIPTPQGVTFKAPTQVLRTAL